MGRGNDQISWTYFSTCDSCKIQRQCCLKQFDGYRTILFSVAESCLSFVNDIEPMWKPMRGNIARGVNELVNPKCFLS